MCKYTILFEKERRLTCPVFAIVLAESQLISQNYLHIMMRIVLILAYYKGTANRKQRIEKLYPNPCILFPNLVLHFDSYLTLTTFWRNHDGCVDYNDKK